MISFVAAMSKGRVMGKDGKLPWGQSMASDRQRYHDLIRGKDVVIGAGTYSPNSQENKLVNHLYVLSRHNIELGPHAEIIRDVETVLALDKPDKELIVAGGGQVFTQLLPHTHKLYLTYIDADLDGTVHFPDFDEEKWEKIEDEHFSKDKQNQYNYRFITLVKNKNV